MQAITDTNDGRAPITREQLESLIERASAGDPTVRVELASYFADDPNGRKLVADGSVSTYAASLGAVIRESSHSLMMQEGARASLAALRSALLGSDPTPLERLLADLVVLAWQRVCQAEAKLSGPPSEGWSFRQAEFLERRLSHASKRFISAARSLATVRRLAVPPSSVVNVTLAQQNNIDGSADVLFGRLVNGGA